MAAAENTDTINTGEELARPSQLQPELGDASSPRPGRSGPRSIGGGGGGVLCWFNIYSHFHVAAQRSVSAAPTWRSSQERTRLSATELDNF